MVADTNKDPSRVEIPLDVEEENLDASVQVYQPPQEEEKGKVSLKDFLTEFGEVFKERIANEMTPLFNPFNLDEKDMERSSRLENLTRKLKPGQVPAVLALAKGFMEADHRGLILCGQMGTGKTICGLAVAYLLGVKRVLVMCPGHLVQKWIREAKQTIPGVKTVNLNDRSLEDLIALKTKTEVIPDNLWDEKQEGFGNMEVWVLGKERAKLHYQTRPSFITKTGRVKLTDGTYATVTHPCCPRCHKRLDEDELCFRKLARKPRPVCPHCGEMMYQPDKKFRRIAKADFIQRFLRDSIDLFIADEVHELKGGTTGQGQAFADLAAACKRTLALTGTLMGGYSTNLYYLLWRIMPREMREQKMRFGQEMTFAGRYGILQRTYVSEDDYNKIVIGGYKGRLVRTSERPGISPLLLTDFLLPYTVFLRLSDVEDSLPPYAEKVVSVKMQEAQRETYLDYEKRLVEEVKAALSRGDKRLLGKMIQSLLAYPDGCTTRGEVITLDNGKGPEVIAVAPKLDDIDLPKIGQMMNSIKWETSQGRKVLVCLEHTGNRDLVPGLVEHIEKEGFKTLVLRADTVKAEFREEWLAKMSKERVFDVLITNPKLVMTGLDLIEYPSIFFYQTGYSIFVLRQASKRSWRIGQEEPVRVYFACYAETVQEKALKLIASKLETALAVEGDLSDKGLAALSESESSMLFALARELISGKDDGVTSVEDLFAGFSQMESQSDSYIGSPKPLKNEEQAPQETLETEIKEKLVSIFRGKIEPQVWRISKTQTKNVGVCQLDGKWQLTFRDGEIFYDGKLVGKYYKEGVHTKGELRGKPIQVVKLKDEIFARLYTFEPAGDKEVKQAA